jgi:hypothetical protein
MAKNILILTDISGGTWDAVRFAVKFLRNGKTTINLLPSRFSDSEIHKIVFVTDPYNQPSAKVLDKLRYLESIVRSGIHILFIVKNDTYAIPENIKSNIIKHLSGIKATTDYLHNASMDLNQNYQDLASRNLVVIEKTNYQRFRRSITKNLKLSLNRANGIPVLLIVP